MQNIIIWNHTHYIWWNKFVCLNQVSTRTPQICEFQEVPSKTISAVEPSSLNFYFPSTPSHPWPCAIRISDPGEILHSYTMHIWSRRNSESLYYEYRRFSHPPNDPGTTSKPSPSITKHFPYHCLHRISVWKILSQIVQCHVSLWISCMVRTYQTSQSTLVQKLGISFFYQLNLSQLGSLFTWSNLDRPLRLPFRQLWSKSFSTWSPWSGLNR